MPDQTTPCGAEYQRPGGRQPGDRIVRCGRVDEHFGDHEEADTEIRWPATPAAEPADHDPVAALTFELSRHVTALADAVRDRDTQQARATRAEAERDEARRELAANERTEDAQLAIAEERLRSARQAIADTGYHYHGELGEDIAPRIVEMHSALTRELEQTHNALTATRQQLLAALGLPDDDATLTALAEELAAERDNIRAAELAAVDQIDRLLAILRTTTDGRHPHTKPQRATEPPTWDHTDITGAAISIWPRQNPADGWQIAVSDAPEVIYLSQADAADLHAWLSTALGLPSTKTLTRCCAHPACTRTYQADVGPTERGWTRLRGLTVLCPDHPLTAVPGSVTGAPAPATPDELRAAIAHDIRAELVCCDAYDQGTDHLDHPDAHHICYWGEAAARIAEQGTGEPDPKPRIETLSWDHRDQPDLTGLARILRDLAGLHLIEITTGSDDYGIAISTTPITQEQAYQAWTAPDPTGDYDWTGSGPAAVPRDTEETAADAARRFAADLDDARDTIAALRAHIAMIDEARDETRRERDNAVAELARVYADHDQAVADRDGARAALRAVGEQRDQARRNLDHAHEAAAPAADSAQPPAPTPASTHQHTITSHCALTNTTSVVDAWTSRQPCEPAPTPPGNRFPRPPRYTNTPPEGDRIDEATTTPHRAAEPHGETCTGCGDDIWPGEQVTTHAPAHPDGTDQGDTP